MQRSGPFGGQWKYEATWLYGTRPPAPWIASTTAVGMGAHLAGMSAAKVGFSV
jgi:hypothetical protein